MSTTLIVWILTVLAGVVVILTRLRLSSAGGGGSFPVSRRVGLTHFAVGSLTWVLWVVYLFAPDDTPLGGAFLGIVAVGGWWVTALAGLVILMRWMPSRGKHVTRGGTDSWSEGPGLSILAHVGMLVGVVVFTVAYLTAAV